jgi:hypothetical protein
VRTIALIRSAIPSHLTQRLAPPLIAGLDNSRFIYRWLSRTRTKLGLGMSIRPGLVPVEQPLRIGFDRSLADGAIGLSRAVCQFVDQRRYGRK